MRLKSRTKFPPGEFAIILPEIGMKQSIQGSFNECVDAFALIVKRNPAQAQRYNWPTDRANQELFVEDQNARRLVAAGWTQFVESSDPSAPVQYSPVISKKNDAQPVSAVKQATQAYKDLFQNGPVVRELAEKRASTCLACPQNNTRDSIQNVFVETVASSLRALISLTKDMGLTTSHDDLLGICEACGCAMKSKVHVRIEKLTGNMPQNVRDKLNKENPVCWIKSEGQF